MMNVLKRLIENIVKNEISNFIFERKRKQPKILFHGTSSKYLQKILQNGIIPNPKEGAWKNKSYHGNLHNPALDSLYGSYWTNNLLTAYSAAVGSADNIQNDASKYNKIIVIAQIVPQTAKADEDDIRTVILNAFRNSNSQLFGARDPESYAWALKGIVDADEETNGKTIKNIINEFINMAHTRLKISEKSPVYKDELYKGYYTTLNRMLSYLDVKNNSSYKWEYLNNYKRELEINTNNNTEKVKDLFDKKKKNISFITFEKKAEEKLFLDFLDKISSRYRKSALDFSGDRFQTNLRVTKPIGFTGRNKIISIVEIYSGKFENSFSYRRKRIYNRNRGTLKIVYGNRIPKEFLDEYSSKLNSNYDIVDKNNKLLFSSI